MQSNVSFSWHPFEAVNDLIFHQVYGFCRLKNNKYLLVRDWDELRFMLPGGRVEKEERPINCFIREVEEEAQVNIQILSFLVHWKLQQIRPMVSF